MMKWVGCGTHRGEDKYTLGFVGEPEGLRILGKKSSIHKLERHGVDKSSTGQEQMVGSCEYGEESSGSIRVG
jgi:hypothetical protein